MKIITIIGARPQFVKEAILGEALRNANIEEILINTGQHYDSNMSDVFVEGLALKAPDYNLGIGSGTHAFQTGTAMIRLEEVMLQERPDLVLVYGDTNATLAGALAAAKLKIPVAHVEAGLRQHPKDMPEEINRVVTDHVSSLLLCPTKKAVENLAGEGISKGVHFVGDVMYDLFLKIKAQLDIPSSIKRYGLEGKGYFLATVHRDFNTENPSRLKSILSALGEIAKNTPVILPLHPRTRKAVVVNGYESLLRDIQVVEPLGYQDMMALLIGSKKVITDSGGLQKEAFFAEVPALVMMPDTAWIELVEDNFNVLVDADRDEIIKEAFKETAFKNNLRMSLYGEGNASHKIVDILINAWGVHRKL